MSYLSTHPVKLARAKELRRQATPDERLLWQRLRTNQLAGFHFYRQKVVDGFIVDFYCPAARLVVEVDGGIHESQQEYDAERDAMLTAHGLWIMRIANHEVQTDIASVLARILDACRTATSPSPHPNLAITT